jgi:hypothetical protein
MTMTDALRPLLEGAVALLRALDASEDRPVLFPVPVPVRPSADACTAADRRSGLGWDRC